MNIKRILLSATASLLIASSLVGCARVGETPYVGDGNEAVTVTPLAYKYGETEKAQLAADGLFCDFENESVGIKYEADATSTVTGGIFSYRPKLSVFEIVSSEDGHALRYERSAQSAAQNTDPHFDVELGGNIPARVDFVAEYDIMPLSDGIKCNMFQTIYRPSSGRIMGASVSLDGTELKWNGTAIAEIPKGEYTKVACVMHQSNGTLDIYVNGYMVQYGLSYIKTSDTGHEPDQVRVINSNSGECSAIIDNVAVYRGSEPKYISRVSEDDIKTVHKYGFEGAEGAYAGEDGLTVGSGNSTYNIIKTPDGRSVLRDSVVSAGNMSISTAGCERIRAFSVEFYLTSEESDYTLVAFRGDSWTNVLEIRGNMLWSSIDDKPVREIETHRWTRADVFIDGIKNACAIYVDGYRYVDGVSVPADALEKMDSIRIGATSTPEKSYSVYLDNIHLYNATGVLGYKGAASGGAETVYTVVDPDSYQYAGSTVAGELIITDEVKGSGDTIIKLQGYTSRATFSLDGTGLTKQATGDYDFTDIDAVRMRLYCPRNAGRSFIFILDCGTIYRDANGKDYFDGNWVKGSDGKFTCDKYPGVKTTPSEGSGWSYYHCVVTMDFEGWATVTIPVELLKGNRTPDWRHIEGIRLESQGWDLDTKENAVTLLPDSKAEYYIDTIELIVYG